MALGFLLLGMAATIAGDAWKTPAMVLALSGAASVAVGVGAVKRASWTRWLLVPLIAAGTLIALFLLAGSLVWPESAVIYIGLAYATFLALEALTWRSARLASSSRTPSPTAPSAPDASTERTEQIKDSCRAEPRQNPG